MKFNFIKRGTVFESFATYDELVLQDSKLFEANEGLTEEKVFIMLAQSSQRILSMIKATAFWQQYNFKRNPLLNNDIRLVPDVIPQHIKSRIQDFKDLNVAHTLSTYLLPSLADWNTDSADQGKMLFYKQESQDIFKIIIEAGDFYDYTQDGTVVYTEVQPNVTNRVRVR